MSGVTRVPPSEWGRLLARRRIVSRSITILSVLLFTTRALASSAEVCELPPEPPAASGVVDAQAVPPRLVEHGPRSLTLVALTFDACTTREKSPYDERITRILEATRTPATIFVGGGWAAREAAQLSSLAKDPLFELGNHSYSHPHMSGESDEVVAAELLRTQAEVFALTGRVPELFRPPFGEYDDHLVRAAARLGLTTVEYDLASGDPDASFTKERLVASVLRRVKPGSIVVMHINHQRFHTAEALPQIIAGLRARGFELVTVGQMLKRERAAEVALGLASLCPGPAFLVDSPLSPSEEELGEASAEAPARADTGWPMAGIALAVIDGPERRRPVTRRAGSRPSPRPA